MSDIVKLNIKSKNLKGIITDASEQSGKFVELPEVIEREKQEYTHKVELEKEYKKGYEKGIEDATAELSERHSEDLLNQSKDFYNILSTFEEKIKVFENDFHKMVIHISEKLVDKILQREFESKSEIQKILDENLRKIIGANDIVIKLNPKDYELLQKSNKEYLGSTGITKIKFEQNDNIQLGGCLVESEIGNLDARVESQINELIKAIENKFSGIESE